MLLSDMMLFCFEVVTVSYWKQLGMSSSDGLGEETQSAAHEYSRLLFWEGMQM